MRGIIISPVKIIGKNSMQASGAIDPIKLRQYLLYWDKIDFPQNNLIGFGESPEIEYLKKEGIMQQTNVRVTGNGELTELYLKAQLKVLEINNGSEKGRWTLGQENIELVLPKGESVMEKGIELDLYNSLPIPTEDTSLEDVLMFKDKRKDELLEFRSLMDNFYLELLKSGDSERAVIAYIDRIQNKVGDIDRVMNESMFNRIRGNVKVRFDLKDAMQNTFIGLAGGHKLGFPTTAAFLGFGSSFINIEAEMFLKPKNLSSELKDYAYLYYASDESIIE